LPKARKAETVSKAQQNSLEAKIGERYRHDAKGET
jgi:hypothetical protein